MLFVDHGEGQVLERNVFGEQCMGADGKVRPALGQIGQDRIPGLAFLPPGQKGDGQTGGGGERFQGREMLAGENFRGRHEDGLGPGLHRPRHGQKRHQGLARSDVALQQAQHAFGRGHVAGDLGHGHDLRRRQSEGQGLGDPVHDLAVARGCAARNLAHVAAHQGEGELVGQKFVIGGAAMCRGVGGRVGVGFRVVQGFDGRAPGGPAFPRRDGGVEPVGQLGRGLDRGQHRAPEGLGRQAGGHWVDGLRFQNLVALGHRHDVVRMGYLQVVAVAFDDAGHNAGFALGQDLGQVIVPGMKEHEGEKTRIVGNLDLVGLTAVVGFGVGADGHGQGGDAPGFGLGDLGGIAAVDDPGRQMEQQIKQPPAAAQLFDHRSHAWTDAGQRRHGLEQWEQDFRAHFGAGPFRRLTRRVEATISYVPRRDLSIGTGPQMDARRKRILFRAQHCGMKENDIILGGFAEARIEALSEADLDAFEVLLKQPDNDVYTWVSGRAAPPAEFATELMRQILVFNDQ